MQPHTLHAPPIEYMRGGGGAAGRPTPPPKKKVTNPFPADTPTLPSSRFRKNVIFCYGVDVFHLMKH